MPQNPGAILPLDENDDPPPLGAAPTDTSAQSNTGGGAILPLDMNDHNYLKSGFQSSRLEPVTGWDKFKDVAHDANELGKTEILPQFREMGNALSKAIPNQDLLNEQLNSKDSRFPGMGYLNSYGTGFLKGASEGAGNVASGMTSLYNAALYAAGAGAESAAQASLPELAYTVKLGQRALGLPAIYESTSQALDPNASWADRAMAAANTAVMGGMVAEPTPVKRPAIKTIADTAVQDPRQTQVYDFTKAMGREPDISPYNGPRGGPPPPPAAGASPIPLTSEGMLSNTDIFQHPNTETGPPAVGGGATVRIKVPNQETVNALKEQGFNFIQVDENGSIVMHKPSVPANEPSIEHLDPDGEPSLTTNASGESMASSEALSRQSGMKSRGEQFGVFDRSGNFRPLIGPDSVDYRARPGETYGVQTPNGFRVLDDKGGRVGETPLILDDGQPPAHMTEEGPTPTHDIGAQDYGDLSNFDYSSLDEEPQFHRVTPNPYELANQGHQEEAAKIPPETLPGPNSPVIPPPARQWDVRPGGNEAHIADAQQALQPAPLEPPQGRNPLHEFQPNDAFARQALGEPEPLFPTQAHPQNTEPSLQKTKKPSLYNNFANDARQIKEEMKRGKDFDQAYEGVTGNYETDQHYEDMYNHVNGGEETDPAFAKVNKAGKSRAQIGINLKRSARELTSGYSQHIAAIMGREGVQNGFDVLKGQPNPGNLHVTTHQDYIEVSDDGRGMSPEELHTVYTNLHESGKTNDPNSTGGKGVGKAPFMLGGEHFEVTTVKEVNGKKLQSSFSGTPEELMEGFDIHTKVVSPTTPTGTKFRTRFTQDAQNPLKSQYASQDMIENIGKYSRGINVNFTHDKWGHGIIDKYDIPDGSKDRIIAKEQRQHNDFNIIVPPDAVLGHRSGTRVHYLNQGMYQFSKGHSFGEASHGIPDHIIVDVRPKVKEGADEYPFPVQRESLKEGVQNDIDNVIDDRIQKEFVDAKKKDLTKLWNDMPVIRKSATSGRDLVIFDPGDRLTASEKRDVMRSPVVHSLLDNFDNTLDGILGSVGAPGWVDRVERVGITLDPTMHGVHIPNPQSVGGGANSLRTMILINPFSHFDFGGVTPLEGAMNTVTTQLHEVAHVGRDLLSTAKLSPADLSDPHAASYLQTYLQHVQDSTGGDISHQTDFIQRLGHIYARFGTRNGIAAAKEIAGIVGDGSGGYNPEFQKLLQVYSESRGRPATTEDILSGTGTKQKVTGGPKGSVPSSNETNAGGVSPESDNFLKKVPMGQTIVVKAEHSNPANIKQLMQQGFEFKGVSDDGRLRFTKTGKQYTGPVLESEVGQTRPRSLKLGPEADRRQGSLAGEIFNLPRAVMASMDLSAPLRQGLGLVHKPEFWQALPGMVKSFGSEKIFQSIQDEIASRPLFKERVGVDGKNIPSFAQDAGLKLTDLTDVSKQEEAFMSNLANKIPLVRNSERAYVGFLNKLRADTFENLIKNYNVISPEGKVDIPTARGLAEFVNRATGRGTLGSLEAHAVLLNKGLFSPRLIASRVQMLNPATYIMGNKAARIESLKSLFAIAAAGNMVLQLGKMAGGTVNTDPTSSDFAKLKIGNTRIDPWGGFQQYVVAANRLIKPPVGVGHATHTGIVPLDLMTGMAATPGMHLTSTNTGRTMSLLHKQKPFDPTLAETGERFVRGKLHPVLNFAWSLLDGAKEMSGAPMKFSTLNPMENAITQRFIPMVAQDTYDLYKLQPNMLPAAGLGAVGMGVQTYTPNQNRHSN